MSMTIRAATPMERMYTYTQSQQIIGQTSCVGHLRFDMGREGNEFHTMFEDHKQELKTEEFKAEFNDVIQQLRNNKTYSKFLKSRSNMIAYSSAHPESMFNDGHCYMTALRVDTEKYAYLLRLNPMRGDYSYCYVYQRDRLDNHLENAARGIQIRSPWSINYCHLEDGDRIRIIHQDNSLSTYIARYVDVAHMELFNGRYYEPLHIDQFAKYWKDNNYKDVIPLRKSLPEKCYSTLAETGEIIVINKGKSGYQNTNIQFTSKEDARSIAAARNKMLGVTKAQEEAMKVGSMFGWHVPAADPKNYDERGQLRMGLNRDRSGAR